MPLIRDRVAALGLGDAHVSSVLGASLHTLDRDPDHRTVGLTLLVRLSRLLEMPLDDVVLTGDPTSSRPNPRTSSRPRSVMTISCSGCWPPTTA